MPENSLDWTQQPSFTNPNNLAPPPINRPPPTFLGPPLQSPPGFQQQGNHQGFGWRIPGRRIPIDQGAIGMPNNEIARQQAMIAAAMANHPVTPQPIMPQPQQQAFDPMMFAGGQIGTHVLPPILKGTG